MAMRTKTTDKEGGLGDDHLGLLGHHDDLNEDEGGFVEAIQMVCNQIIPCKSFCARNFICRQMTEKWILFSAGSYSCPTPTV